MSGFGFQIRDPEIEAAVEWSRPWCRNPAVVLSFKKRSGMLDRGPGRGFEPGRGGLGRDEKGAPQALLLEARSPREQKPSSALPTAPSCGVWDSSGPRGERPRGGSPGYRDHPCRVRACCLPCFPAPQVPDVPGPRRPRMNGRRVRPPRQDGDARLCQLGPRRPSPGLKTKAGPGSHGRGRREKRRGPRFAWTPLCGEGASCPEPSPGVLAYRCLLSLDFPWGTAAWLLTF